MRDLHFSLSNRTRGALPRIPFLAIKNAVLGERYELSLALLPPRAMRRISRKHRGKDKASNVLSFRLSPASGELLLCPSTARREAPLFGASYRSHLGRLFIHGLLHLKGFAHSATMESTERDVVKRFGL